MKVGQIGSEGPRTTWVSGGWRPAHRESMSTRCARRSTPAPERVGLSSSGLDFSTLSCDTSLGGRGALFASNGRDRFYPSAWKLRHTCARKHVRRPIRHLVASSHHPLLNTASSSKLVRLTGLMSLARHGGNTSMPWSPHIACMAEVPEGLGRRGGPGAGPTLAARSPWRAEMGTRSQLRR